ncbi:hypothetical protein OD91_0202 [Lutibacter sp. Hel_I_33_5]|uniref:VWA domain-containing protein n=1 Tax=Lutibacter sp. Hel_I_33_5 TaxID=1566289 RepID=UPI0011AC5C78|nr:VWA domain-containing protein [Lutibacter sp. Hel_I_33_5]TVZ54963.1 hypothetical protein OD91_0202 [Lutibacter sp. Hel_I_33_5]
MQTTTIFYIVLALFLSVGVAYFQYFFKNKDKRSINYVWFGLKALSLFLLSLLFINPKITTTQLKNTKPVLSVLVDNSSSTSYFNQKEYIYQFIDKLKSNTSLNTKFDVTFLSFDNNTKTVDSLDFTGSQTNISEALRAVNQLNKNTLNTSILISDGNQTIGNDYEYVKSKQAVFPLVIGDTTQYKDVKLSQLNINKYSYIKNKFPVEALVFYDGKETVNTQLSIYSGSKTLFTKKITLSPENNTQTIVANLSSTKVGQQYYTASIRKLQDEKNTKNNSKRFSVEVIDEQTKVLLLSSIIHPDLGTLKKAIESNKQRKVDIELVHKFNKQIKDYQLVIFYQPNNNFRKFFTKETSNFLLISGDKADWNFINSLNLGINKKAIYQSENYGAIYNDQFLTYFQKDIGFSDFPPLKDKFGQISLGEHHQTLLYQKINGLESTQPLVSSFEQNSKKYGVIFGEGLWKWRGASFRQSSSFEDFDDFIGNLVQYLASTKKRKRLEVSSESLYPSNATIPISAFYVDKNYQFDARAILELTLTNTDTKKQKKYPFSLMNNSFQLSLENITAGNYSYKVSVLGENVSRYGKFKVTEYNVEEQFTNANADKLEKLANRTGGKLFFNNQEDDLLNELINDKKYYTTQKSIEKEQNLIDWKWILFLVIGLLSIEWFSRKYYGKL